MPSLFAYIPLALFLAGLSAGLQAQTALPADPLPQVNLSASAHQQVRQDWLRVVVRTALDGAEAMAVQKQLKTVVDEALVWLRPQLQARQLEVFSGHFGIHPRHNDKGRVVGWQGQAELIIEGRDFARIAQVAGEVPRMAVESAQFSLSREGRQQVEADVQSLAVHGFRQKAQQVVKDLGFGGYTVRQLTVGTVERPRGPMPMMARSVAAMDAAPSPVLLESGKDEVQVTVSGSIELR